MENGDIGSQPFVEPVRLDTKFNIFDTFWLERGERSLPKIEPARHISAACLGIGKYVVRPLEIEAQRIGWIIEIGGLRSEERREGKECVSMCRSRRSPDH